MAEGIPFQGQPEQEVASPVKPLHPEDSSLPAQGHFKPVEVELHCFIFRATGRERGWRRTHCCTASPHQTSQTEIIWVNVTVLATQMLLMWSDELYQRANQSDSGDYVVLMSTIMSWSVILTLKIC